MSFQEKIIFIVGNSRSGTTLLLRVFNNHPNVFVLNELHFFEQLWTTKDKDKVISKEQAIDLFCKLLLTHRIGYKTHDQNHLQFYAESKHFIDTFDENVLTAEFVFTEMMKREAFLNHKSIVCEKTPQNVFYIKEILDLYPNAKIINMVRDPRAILLSQKNKWNRRSLGSNYMTKKEAFRLRINYHPITISKLWNSAVNAANLFKNEKRLLSVRFEDLLENPEQTIRKICTHVDIEFENNMLHIKQESSSVEKDSNEIGFKKERASNWQKGGLNTTEIWWNEKICKQNLIAFSYPLTTPKFSFLFILYYLISFPIKLIFALLLNLDRMKNIFETLKRRMT